MPEQGQDWEAGSNARVSGWGTLSSGGSSPDTLQAVNVPVVSDADCTDAYGSDMDGPTMICAGEEGLDSCQGDSGGPMTCGENDDGEVSLGLISLTRPKFPLISIQTRSAASSRGAAAAPWPDTPASTPRPPPSSTGPRQTPPNRLTDGLIF